MLRVEFLIMGSRTPRVGPGFIESVPWVLDGPAMASSYDGLNGALSSRFPGQLAASLSS
jgi:hypothetical protein